MRLGVPVAVGSETSDSQQIDELDVVAYRFEIRRRADYQCPNGQRTTRQSEYVVLN